MRAEDRTAERGLDLLRRPAVMAAALLLLEMLLLRDNPGADSSAHLTYARAVLDGRLPTLAESYVANHPPLFYLVAAPLTWLLGMWGLRLVNAACMVVAVLLVQHLAGELGVDRDRAGWMIALCPLVIGVGGRGYTDGLALVIVCAVGLVSVRVLRHGPTIGRLTALCGLCAAGAATRASLLVLVVVACAVWMVAGRLAGVVAIAAAPAVTTGWFWLRNLDLYGDLTGADALTDRFGRTDQGSIVDLLTHPDWLVGAWSAVWASMHPAYLGPGRVGLGSADPTFGPEVLIGLGVAVLAVAGWRGWLAWPLVAIAGLSVVGMASFVAEGGTPHGRYLFPVLPLVCVLVPRGAGRWSAVVIGALVAVDVILFVQQARVIWL